MYTKGYDFMHHKICTKCGITFETKNRSKKFCCRSCANSFTTALRKIPDESIFMNGISNTNAYVLGLIYSDGCLSYDNHSHWYVKIYEKESLTKFYNWIYNDAELFLLRKKLKFTEMI